MSWIVFTRIFEQIMPTNFGFPALPTALRCILQFWYLNPKYMFFKGRITKENILRSTNSCDFNNLITNYLNKRVNIGGYSQRVLNYLVLSGIAYKKKSCEHDEQKFLLLNFSLFKIISSVVLPVFFNYI